MYLGIDIGTTSVCAVVIDENGGLLRSLTQSNTFGYAKGPARMQNADGIAQKCREICAELSAAYPIASIGVSGQMHGILYVNAEGAALSPLYSWQDERGNLPADDGSYAEELSRRSGCRVSTGYGCCSVYYDVRNGAVPPDAAAFCTIGDYVAMQLCGRKAPLVHDSCAASLGLFDLQNRCWDEDAIQKAGMPRAIFPRVTDRVEALGLTPTGATVYTCIGDNQASVYGSVRDESAFLLNIGTGSQISMISRTYVKPPVGEVRPYLNGAYLVAGCPLCGGYSYRLLKDFFDSVAGEVSYDTMNAWALSALAAQERGTLRTPAIAPTFRGTREDPARRASITGLSEANFNAPALTLGVLKGISGELREFYTAFAALLGERTWAVGAGNAVRLNEALRRVLREDFGCEVSIPAHTEEASFGAARAAAQAHTGENFNHWIQYQA